MICSNPCRRLLCTNADEEVSTVSSIAAGDAATRSTMIDFGSNRNSRSTASCISLNSYTAGDNPFGRRTAPEQQAQNCSNSTDKQSRRFSLLENNDSSSSSSSKNKSRHPKQEDDYDDGTDHHQAAVPKEETSSSAFIQKVRNTFGWKPNNKTDRCEILQSVAVSSTERGCSSTNASQRSNIENIGTTRCCQIKTRRSRDLPQNKLAADTNSNAANDASANGDEEAWRLTEEKAPMDFGNRRDASGDENQSRNTRDRANAATTEDNITGSSKPQTEGSSRRGGSKVPAALAADRARGAAAWGSNERPPSGTSQGDDREDRGIRDNQKYFSTDVLFCNPCHKINDNNDSSVVILRDEISNGKPNDQGSKEPTVTIFQAYQGPNWRRGKRRGGVPNNSNYNRNKRFIKGVDDDPIAASRRYEYNDDDSKLDVIILTDEMSKISYSDDTELSLTRLWQRGYRPFCDFPEKKNTTNECPVNKQSSATIQARSILGDYSKKASIEEDNTEYDRNEGNKMPLAITRIDGGVDSSHGDDDGRMHGEEQINKEAKASMTKTSDTTCSEEDPITGSASSKLVAMDKKKDIDIAQSSQVSYGCNNDIDCDLAKLIDLHLQRMASAMRKQKQERQRLQMQQSPHKVLAPAGKLGISVKSAQCGALVRQVREDSPLLDVLKEGDVIVAIDDTDTRAMSAADIFDLVASSSTRTRNLSVISEETGDCDSSATESAASAKVESP